MIKKVKVNMNNRSFLEGYVSDKEYAKENGRDILKFLLTHLSLTKPNEKNLSNCFTCPVNVVMYDSVARKVNEFVNNGDLIEVEGKLRHTSFNGKHKIIATHIKHTEPITRDVEIEEDKE